MRLRRPVLLAITCSALVLTACTQALDGTGSAGRSSASPSTPSAPSPAPGGDVAPAEFRDCDALLSVPGVTIGSGLKGKLSAECSTVAVPVDYARPSGPELPINLVRIHDSDNPGHEPLLGNPGGPGGSGIELALGLLSKFPAGVLTKYDLVGFDPRGAQYSAPVTCLSNAEKDAFFAASPDVTTTTGFSAAKALARQFSTGCKDRMGSALQYYNTVNSAKDMDRVRAALGAATMNYIGFSYGTELGSVYAHLFPDRVGAMVLDGAVDPLTSGIEQATEQLRGFENAFDQFAANCRTTSPCSSLGNARTAATAVEAAALAAPLSTSSRRALTAALAATGVEQALYSKQLWPRLGKALIAAGKGDGTGLLALADDYYRRTSDGKYSNLFDAFITISCNDTAPGPSDADIRRTAAAWVREFPLLGKWFAIGLFSCQQWQPNRVVPPKPTADVAGKVLVVGNLHDPATPYRGAEDLTRTIGDAELLTWDGEGHTSYLQGSKCVDNYVDAYLVTEQLPPDETTCPR